MAFALRRAVALLALSGPLSLSACFDVKDAPPLGGDSSTGPSMTTEPGTTMEPDDTTTATPDPTTGDPAESSTGPVDPGTSTGPDDPDTGSSGGSSGPPVEPICGDGTLDLDLGETCDDGNLDDGDLCDASCQVETVVFVHTGGVQLLDVPAWVDSLEVEAWGAEGGGSSCSDGSVQLDDGGLGGQVTGVLPGVGGTTLEIRVGGQGVVDGAGGFNGGGDGGLYGGGGGGATDVRTGPMLGDRVFVAAGGGAGNCGGPDHGEGGNGGGLSGAAGVSFQGLPPGGGGTQAAGGTAGEYTTAGTLGQGGSGMTDLYHVGGGGGGYYGGGGGYGAGGGGGSSYLGQLLNGTTLPGQREGDGELRLTPIAIR